MANLTHLKSDTQLWMTLLRLLPWAPERSPLGPPAPPKTGHRGSYGNARRFPLNPDECPRKQLFRVLANVKPIGSAQKRQNSTALINKNNDIKLHNLIVWYLDDVGCLSGYDALRIKG